MTEPDKGDPPGARQRCRTRSLCAEHEHTNWHLAGKACPHCQGITNADWEMCGDCALQREVCQVCAKVLDYSELALARSDRWAGPSPESA